MSWERGTQIKLSNRPPGAPGLTSEETEFIRLLQVVENVEEGVGEVERRKATGETTGGHGAGRLIAENLFLRTQEKIRCIL